MDRSKNGGWISPFKIKDDDENMHKMRIKDNLETLTEFIIYRRAVFPAR